MKLDHIYVETRDFERARSFWTGLGFTVADAWGDGDHRACRLVNAGAAVVLATAHGEPQRATIHFGAPDLSKLAGRAAENPAAEIATPLSDTHWGTQWLRLRDPDGNLYAFESPGQAPNSSS